MGNIGRKLEEIMEGDLTKSNRYLLAAIFKNRPGKRDEVTKGKDEVDSPTK
jgi:hypothetical protein